MFFYLTPLIPLSPLLLTLFYLLHHFNNPSTFWQFPPYVSSFLLIFIFSILYIPLCLLNCPRNTLPLSSTSLLFFSSKIVIGSNRRWSVVVLHPHHHLVLHG